MLRYADVDSLVRHTRSALHDCLGAVLDGDADRAREVLAHRDLRISLRHRAEACLRSRSWVPAPQVADELAFVAAIGHVGDVVDDLARRVLERPSGERLPPSDALDVAALLDAGDRQIARLLALELVGTRSLRDATTTLFAVVDHGTACGSVTVRCCGDLAHSLLLARRHALAVS